MGEKNSSVKDDSQSIYKRSITAVVQDTKADTQTKGFLQ